MCKYFTSMTRRDRTLAALHTQIQATAKRVSQSGLVLAYAKFVVEPDGVVLVVTGSPPSMLSKTSDHQNTKPPGL